MIEIRQAKAADAGCIAELQLAMARETENLALDETAVRAGVRAVFDDPAKGTYYLAQEADRILACLLTIPEWSDWRNATVLWIHSLYVVPQARRRGVFKKLYLNLKEQVLRSPSLAGLRLYVDSKNTSAKETYRKLGMNKDHYELYEWLKPAKPPNK